MFNFEKLDVWHEAIDFADTVYSITRTFPEDERFGLTNQMRRASAEKQSRMLSPSSEAETTDFADDTDNESIPFVWLCTDPPCSRTAAAGRFGEFRVEVPLHPCHPCHPWFSLPVFGLSGLRKSLLENRS
ncbi:MAG: four helix bundle protein [Verrucomicrobia bacterium]|nr:four helix bundle protein [Verrucomicrobiota bacterium]